MTNDYSFELSDIRALLNNWQYLLRLDEYAPYERKIKYLVVLVETFLRGGGCRMGNYQGLDKHLWKYYHLIVLMRNTTHRESYPLAEEVFKTLDSLELTGELRELLGR